MWNFIDDPGQLNADVKAIKEKLGQGHLREFSVLTTCVRTRIWMLSGSHDRRELDI